MIIIHNAIIVNEDREFRGYVVVDGEIISAVGAGSVPDGLIVSGDCEVVNLHGRRLMPGAIDTHVHFREPGMTEKGDIAGESAAAVLGGVTSCIEMPNTRPATVTIEAWQQKMDRAAEVSAVNYAFYLGATNDNLATLKSADYSRIPGVKVFMGSSTGDMLVDDDRTLRAIFGDVNALIAVHAEDEETIKANRETLRRIGGATDDLPPEAHALIRSHEACYKATARAVRMARQLGTRLHITHVTTAQELMLLTPGDNVAAKQITAETCPHYLVFDARAVATLGSRVKCNPAIKDASDSAALLEGLRTGLIDTIATDHAPHLPAQKQGGALKAASGMPGLQFAVAVLLGRLSATELARKMCHNPAEAYRIDRRGFIRPGYFADLTVVDELPEADALLLTDEMAAGKCGWTPYAGMKVTHRVTDTMVNGRWVVRGGALVADAKAAGRALRFGALSQNTEKKSTDRQ